MLAKVASCALIGLEGAIIEVEADLSARALPQVTLVGLPDAAVKESTERVRAAIVNSGLQTPRGRLTVNLAPGRSARLSSHRALPDHARPGGRSAGLGRGFPGYHGLDVLEGCRYASRSAISQR